MKAQQAPPSQMLHQPDAPPHLDAKHVLAGVALEQRPLAGLALQQVGGHRHLAARHLAAKVLAQAPERQVAHLRGAGI